MSRGKKIFYIHKVFKNSLKKDMEKRNLRFHILPDFLSYFIKYYLSKFLHSNLYNDFYTKNVFIKTLFLICMIVVLSPLVCAQDSQSNFQKGEAYYIEGKFQIAKVFLEKALIENPENYIIYYYLGNITFFEGDFQKALTYYLKGVEFNRDTHIFYYNIALTYYNLQQYQNAIDYFQKVLNIQPDNSSVFLNMGFCYYFLKDKENTIKYWTLYVQNPTDPVKKEKILYFIQMLQDPNFKFPETSSTGTSTDSASTSTSTSTSTSSSSTSSTSNIDTSLIDNIIQTTTIIEEVPPEPTDSEEAL